MLKNRYNFFLLARNIFFTFYYADWNGAYQTNGILGLIIEFFRSLVGANTWPFFIDSNGSSKGQIQNILGHYHIKMWGWGYSQGYFFFRVKRRQAHWCQDILLQKGVPIKGRLFQENSSTKSRNTPAQRSSKESHQHPPQEQRTPQDRAKDTSFNIFDEINKLADKLNRL